MKEKSTLGDHLDALRYSRQWMKKWDMYLKTGRWETNTHKMTSPLPNIEGMLRCMVRRNFRTALNLKAVYEQIRIVPEHVQRVVVMTSNRNMVSHVVQQGDCNAPVTYLDKH